MLSIIIFIPEISKPASFIIARIGPDLPVLTAFGLMIANVKSPFITACFVIIHPALLFTNIAYLYAPEIRAANMPDLSKYTKRISEHFFKSDNILLISHINPDADAIG